MVSPEAIQARLSALKCPICQHSQFFIHPQSDQGYAEQIYKARCTTCAYSFQVSIPTKPLNQTDPDLDHRLTGLICPLCHAHGATLDFRCMPSVRECIYFVTCAACHHPFQEQAPMEAYE